MIFLEYWPWLVVVSVLVMLLERLRPWRPGQPWQPWIRPQFAQDVFWIVFNGYVFARFADPLFKLIYRGLEAGFSGIFASEANALHLVVGLPLWAQVLVAMVVADFFEWCVHNLLHRAPWLWRIHRMHHSIHTMDWIGNFRFHWGEIIIYSTLRYIPVAMLGVPPLAGLIGGVIATAMGHLNHANLNISWGPLRYLLNSPRMHIWHHEAALRGAAGVNFAIVFSVWDWLFGTAYLPGEAASSESPERIGFEGDERVPAALIWRFFLPFIDRPPVVEKSSGEPLPAAK
ncbi:MAG: sterol desaturase family protein [Deltaproteobacteria bacterium]|nr:sterol desaturase family protein [Deltaproteobacteria bacterium]